MGADATRRSAWSGDGGHDGRERRRAVGPPRERDDSRPARLGGTASARGSPGRGGSRRPRSASSAPLPRFTANATGTGSSVATVARAWTRSVSSSGRTTSVGRTGVREGSAASARSRTAARGGIESVSFPAGPSAPATGSPRSVDQVLPGVAVCTVALARRVPALNAARYSCRVARSNRLTTRSGPEANRTALGPVASAGCAVRSAASRSSRLSSG